MPKTLSRRSFLTSFHISWLASWATLILPACRRSASPIATAVAKKSLVAMPREHRSDGFTSIGSLAELQRASHISYQYGDYQQVLVIWTSTKPTQLLAVDPICPHQGCVVRWVTEEQLFGCPCHGGEFNEQGQPRSGPPTTALPKYQVKIEYDQVWVRLPVDKRG
jgi:cytochrome b6-f complex iron-sulfur subunit